MCVFRVYGDQLDAQEFLAGSDLNPYSVFRQGDLAAPRSKRRHNTSGFKVAVSERDWSDPHGQFEDALRFLRRNSASLRRLAKWPLVESRVLDFPVAALREATFVRIPLELARAAVRLGIEIEISYYPAIKRRERDLP